MRKPLKLRAILALAGVAFAAAIVLLAFAEGALRLFGFGYPTSFFVGGSQPNTLTTNPFFGWQFFDPESATTPIPRHFAAQKPLGTRRVFILGESAAAGTPDPAFGFCRMLETMLQSSATQKVEVINVAMRGIDSYIVQRIADECVQHEPDLLILYCGNNELIGLHAPGENSLAYARGELLQHALNRTRLGQLGTRVRKSLFRHEKPVQDMEFFRRNRIALDDPRREPVYEHHREHVTRICRAGKRKNSRVILSALGSNVRDFPPLGSLNRADLPDRERIEWSEALEAGRVAEAAGNLTNALAKYQRALQIDEHYAELHYRFARVAEALGDLPAARAHYLQARDWDALQFRSDSRIAENIRAVAESQGTLFLDANQAFANHPSSVHQIPGHALFHEHVHLTFEGDYCVATNLLPHVAQTLGLPLVKPLSIEQCKRALAFTKIDEVNVKEGIVNLTKHPPFLDQCEHAARQQAAERQAAQMRSALTQLDLDDAIQTYKSGIQARPDDWFLHFNFASLLSQIRRPAEAAEEFGRVVAEFPNQKNFRSSYGYALLAAHRPVEAREQFEAALKLDASFKPARQGLAAAH